MGRAFFRDPTPTRNAHHTHTKNYLADLCPPILQVLTFALLGRAPVRVNSLLQPHCSSNTMTCKPISTGMSKCMFEASGAVAFMGGARSMLVLQAWALNYEAQCCTYCH